MPSSTEVSGWKGSIPQAAGGERGPWMLTPSRSTIVSIDSLIVQSSIMAFSRTSSSWLASALTLFSFFSLLIPTNALYFYMEGRQTKCFFEDLPKDTLVAGMISFPFD